MEPANVDRRQLLTHWSAICLQGLFVYAYRKKGNFIQEFYVLLSQAMFHMV